VGRVRIRPAGSHGGHNGMRSIIDALGTDAFPRVRVGIGRPGGTGGTPSEIDYVLGRFRRDEEDAIGEAIELVSDAVDCILSDGIDVAMNRFN
jgi:PTH1 family peptidyl-tRNA hydrolase